MPRLMDTILRALLTAGFALVKRRTTSRRGVHAIALTADGAIILVKLRYAPGWRVPGGGLHDGENLRDATLRELREEIGMTAHGPIEQAQVGGDPLLIVRNVRYAPRRWSWEVETIMEAQPDALPQDLAPIAARWLAGVRDRI